jgi:hypothetical protein
MESWNIPGWNTQTVAGVGYTNGISGNVFKDFHMRTHRLSLEPSTTGSSVSKVTIFG